MRYDADVEEKITLLIDTFDELSKNPLYTRAGKIAYANSKREVMQIFYGGQDEEEEQN